MTDAGMTELQLDWTSDGQDEGASRSFYSGTPPAGDNEQDTAGLLVRDLTYAPATRVVQG
jgi:hypothetical protein